MHRFILITFPLRPIIIEELVATIVICLIVLVLVSRIGCPYTAAKRDTYLIP